MKSRKVYRIEAVRKLAAKPKRTVRKQLNADALIQLMREDFRKITDHRAGNAKIPLDDALMSALAMFQLKDPSLLAFDKRRREEPENLHTIWGITEIPCDSQMRDILDPLELSSLRAPFRSAFRQLQRGVRILRRWPFWMATICSAATAQASTPRRRCHPIIAWAKKATTGTPCTISRCMPPPL